MFFVNELKHYLGDKRRYLKYKKDLLPNLELKDAYSGYRCFIIGNGTSLNKMNLLKLQNEYTYVLNSFFRHPQFQQINPTFYSDVSPIDELELLGQERDSIYYPNNYYGAIHHACNDLKIKCFFNVRAKRFIGEHGLFGSTKVYYLLGSTYRDLDVIAFHSPKIGLSSDISKCNSFMSAGGYSAICNCVYMGFNPIYFIGCDCDWFTQKQTRHFYHEDIPMEDPRTNEQLLYDNYLTLRKWRVLTSFFKNRGVRIYNAGVGGDNDTCERVEFDTLF